MAKNNTHPDQLTYSLLLRSCIRLQSFQLGRTVHDSLARSGIQPNLVILNSLITLYSKCGDWETAESIFEDMPDRNVVTWTLMITRFHQLGYGRDAIDVFVDMISSGYMPDRFTHGAVISACTELGSLSAGRQLHTWVIKSGMAWDVCIGCSLVDMYAKCNVQGSLAESRKVFSRMQDHNVMSWTAIITGYVQQNGGDDMEAIELFIEMMQDGRIKPNEFTLAAVIKACAGLSNSQIGEEVYCYAVKVGLASINCVGNSVISMYAKCGRTENARKAFDVLSQRNVISWTSMVTGFAKHGLATRALETFGDMLEAGVKPNDVTYIAVLSACSHAGLVSEGCQHFESMKSKHGIVPRMEHYACIVDLFGRAGRLTEAMYFIDAMPFKPNPLVLRTFLGACQVHGNTNLGKRAADMILDQDPDDPSAYVLLSNLYAAAGQWEEVTEIRKQMKERNLTKEAGCSWIETDNVVHKFHVGDTTHRRAFDIFEELKQLGEEIKELGYVPNTEFVLHDVGEEEKEMYLLQHSERIAVAFGFISSAGSSKPVRVFKNLRICGDCHSAFKYFSVVRDREIVVRDSNRFHHFRNGTCSCNDYW
ncbi:Pentatricopeptide repeat-containing protein At3g49170, chloroplastic [Linum grandiflorum]